MSIENFILGKILGKGSYGSVRLVERKEDHQIYAMKSVVINNLKEKEKQNSFNEVRLLASLKHENIIDYKESFFDEIDKTLNIVMEYADDGDLRTKISQTLKDHMSFEELTIWNVLIQTLKGLKYLHENNIIHRDLKSANIFLTKSGLIKIGDLNVSTIAKKGVANTQTGTPYYASPEIWNDKPYNSKCDIWSLGCIIYEMASLHVPFRGTSLHQLYCRIMKGNYLQIPLRYSNELKYIIKLILNVDSQKRPSAEELLKNDIIIKKMKELGINKKNENEKAMLIKTIKIPINISQINQQLPQKRYELKQRKNKEEMFNNDEYEYSKNNFYKLSNQEQNKIIKESMQRHEELHNENISNNNEANIINNHNININDIIFTTNDTDIINNNEPNKQNENEIIEQILETENKYIEPNKNNNDDLKNFIINQNIENNIKRQEKLKKPYKDTGYHFFIGNHDNIKSIKNNNNNNNNINLFLVNKKQERQNEPKQRKNTGPSYKKPSTDNKKLPNIRPRSTKNYIEKNKIKELKPINNKYHNEREGKNEVKSMKMIDMNQKYNHNHNHNHNNKDNRRNKCISANKRINKNISNVDREIICDSRKKIEKINRNKSTDKNSKNNKDIMKRINKNQININHKKNNSKPKQRPLSMKNYNEMSKEQKFPNINGSPGNIAKNKINYKIYYNQRFKSDNEKKINKNNKPMENKHRIIYERIEIIKKGKKNKYIKGNTQVKYIDIGNHYDKYKNLKNNNYNLRAKNNYQIFGCEKGRAKFIVPNEMMN